MWALHRISRVNASINESCLVCKPQIKKIFIPPGAA